MSGGRASGDTIAGTLARKTTQRLRGTAMELNAAERGKNHILLPLISSLTNFILNAARIVPCKWQRFVFRRKT